MASRLASILVLVIVAATLIAGLIAGAQNEANGPVDLIVLNGRVYTAGGHGEVEEALAVRGNQILKVGSNREIRRLTKAQTTVIDARGGTVVPGLVESRVNLVAAGLASRRLDLREAATVEDVEREIAAYAAAHADRAWIEGAGWDPELFEKLPTRQALDAIVPDRPAYLVSADGRMTWVNSKALAAARIVRRTANPANGVIVKDKRTGEPTGILKDAAQQLVTGVLPAPTPEERERAIEDAIALAHRSGVTSVHNETASPEDLQIMARLRRSGEMALRVYQVLAGAIVIDANTLASFEQVRKQYPEVPLFKTGAVRIAIDAPATDAVRAEQVRQLAASITELDQDGWQAIVSAEDPAAIDTVVQAFDLVAPLADFKSRRHRLEAASTLEDDVAQHLERLGVTVSVTSETAFDPLAAIIAAAESADPSGSARVLRAAIDGVTSLAAYASFDDQRKGTLKAGMLADFVILSDDLFGPADAKDAKDVVKDVKHVKVIMTIFDGKVVYDRATANATNH